MVKLQIIGHLGKDALMNNVNGKNVINFSVAHTEKWTDVQGAQQSKTLWVECAYWTDKTAISQYLTKGTQVYAEGTPEVRTYTGQDGKQGASLSIRVLSVQLLGSPQQQPPAQQPGYGPNPAYPQAQQPGYGPNPAYPQAQPQYPAPGQQPQYPQQGQQLPPNQYPQQGAQTQYPTQGAQMPPNQYQDPAGKLPF